MSAIPDGIGYSYGLEIIVLMTLLYFANGIKKRAVIPTERSDDPDGHRDSFPTCMFGGGDPSPPKADQDDKKNTVV